MTIIHCHCLSKKQLVQHFDIANYINDYCYSIVNLVKLLFHLSGTPIDHKNEQASCISRATANVRYASPNIIYNASQKCKILVTFVLFLIH